MENREEEILVRLDQIVEALHTFVTQCMDRDFYTTSEVAKILGKAEFTVREWCRLGRVWAEKRAVGRGRSKEWIISRDELRRIQNEGLLPP